MAKVIQIPALWVLGMIMANATTVAQVHQNESRAEAIAELLSEARDAYNRKDYRLSFQKYSFAIDRGANRETVAFNAACCAALLGEADEAFRSLQAAVDLGWLDLKKLQNDSDLDSLKSDPRWELFIAQLQATIDQHDLHWNSRAFRSRFKENLTDAEKAAGLSKLWAEVKYNFVNFHLVPGLDWDAEFVACMPKVLATESTYEYYRVLEELIAKLKDAHTNVYLPPALEARFNAQPALRTQTHRKQGHCDQGP